LSCLCQCPNGPNIVPSRSFIAFVLNKPQTPDKDKDAIASSDITKAPFVA